MSERQYEFEEEKDMQAFRENPINACEWMQKKYIGETFEEYQKNRETIKDYEGGVWEYQEIQNKEYLNVYTKEKKTVKVLVDLPRPSEDEIIENKIKELKLKLILGTITAEEREILKLLIW